MSDSTYVSSFLTVEIINEKFTIEVKILRQQHSERMLDLCVCVKSHSNKKTLTSKKLPRALITNNSSLSESYHTSPWNPPSLAVQLQSHISKLKTALPVYIYIHFTCGLTSKKLLVKSYFRSYEKVYNNRENIYFFRTFPQLVCSPHRISEILSGERARSDRWIYERTISNILSNLIGLD